MAGKVVIDKGNCSKLNNLAIYAERENCARDIDMFDVRKWTLRELKLLNSTIT